MHAKKFLTSLLFLASPQTTWALHIVLDPGHGGIDTGAVHANAKEADLVLKVAKQLKKLLEKDTQFKVTLTRNEDHNISLPERVKSPKTHRPISLSVCTPMRPQISALQVSSSSFKTIFLRMKKVFI